MAVGAIMQKESGSKKPKTPFSPSSAVQILTNDPEIEIRNFNSTFTQGVKISMED